MCVFPGKVVDEEEGTVITKMAITGELEPVVNEGVPVHVTNILSA